MFFYFYSPNNLIICFFKIRYNGTPIPYTAIDMAGAILSLPATEYGKIGDKVLLIQTQFGENDFVNGYFVMIPELESYEKILSSLGL